MNPFGVPHDAANLTMHRAAAGVRRSPVCVPAGKQVYGDGRPHAGERAAERLVAEYSTCLYPPAGTCCEQYVAPQYCDVDSLQCCLDQTATEIQQIKQVQVPAPVEFRQITKSRGCGPRSRKRTAGGQNKDERQRKQNFNRWTNGTLAAWGGTVNTPFFTKNDSHQMQDLSEVFLCSTERWGVRQRERLLTDFFCSAWGGNLALNCTFHVQKKLQIPARDLVEHMTLLPRMVMGLEFKGCVLL